MRTESKYKWTIVIAVVLAFGLVAQGVLLWQTRQQVAALNPAIEQTNADEELSDIEKRLLARLEEQDSRRPQSPLDPWGNNAISSGAFATDPFAEFERMRQRMNQSMNAFMGGFSNAGPSMTFSMSSPDIELEETKEDYRLLIRVPEEHEIALQTEVDDREITVSGKISAQADRSGSGFAGQFISSSQFTRRFDLPGEVDDIKMYTEQTEDGMVIVLPKKEQTSNVS